MAKSGLAFEARPARIDEGAIRAALEYESAKPRDIADTLAEMKARKIAEREPNAVVIGSDQVMVFQGRVHGKPESPDDARHQLQQMRGQTHELISAVVVYDQGRPVWRHVDTAQMRMRDISDSFLDAYLHRNWDRVRHCAGAYMLEEEGVRLFSDVQGDSFTIQGMPLLPLLNYLADRRFIDG